MEAPPVPFGYMHEDEVRNMILNYNSALGEFARQVDELTMINQTLEAKFRSECSRNRALTEELQQAKLGLERTTVEVEQQTKLNQVLTNALHAPPASSAWPQAKAQLTHLFESLSTKEELEQTLSHSETLFQSLEAQNSALRSELSQLLAELAARKEQDSHEVRCLKCHQHFIPLANSDQACHFHPGKLKYYSCKGCGDDQYFTCCNRCERCLPGCKLGRHVPL